MDWIADPQAWIALLTLTSLELVLGIDNIVFISILASKLPEEQRPKARRIGLAVAMISRLALLFSIAALARLTQPLFHLMEHGFSGRDLILIAGGLFLLGKSAIEIHAKLEGTEHGEHEAKVSTFRGMLLQILVIDLVFSLDSVITAVGMVEHVGVMVAAIVISVGLMILFANPVGHFVERRPTVKMLALCFLLLVGTALIADGLGHHIPRGYIYFAMAFSILVEVLNLRVRGGKGLRRPGTPEGS
jgi:predicted tellurium resistance membrane protein TerC